MTIKKVILDMNNYLKNQENQKEHSEFVDEIKVILDLACSHVFEYYSDEDCQEELPTSFINDVLATERCVEWLSILKGE